MNNQLAESAEEMKSQTVAALQDLVCGLNDSVAYHREAASKIDDDYVASVFQGIAKERQTISEKIGSFVKQSDEQPTETGSLCGSLRSIWTAFRAGLNGGNPEVVLIEAERAEDVIVNKFKDILPQIAGNPVNDTLHESFKQVKDGHDRVLALRNAYQAK